MEPTRPPMQVLESRVYRGPNPYGYRRMIRFVLDLGILEYRPTSRLPGFAGRLLHHLPGLARHGCSYGEPGGFVRRLDEGTWLGHVVEHVAIELQNRVGADVSHGKTRGVRGRPGVYDVVYEYEHETVGLLAGHLALRLVDALLPERMRGVNGLEHLAPSGAPDEALLEGAAFRFQEAAGALARAAERVALGPSTRALVRAAAERDVPVRRLDDDSFVQLGHGALARRLRASVTSHASALGVETAGDKLLTNRLLEDAGLLVPSSREAASADEAVEAAERLGYPVAVKPVGGNHGRGVSLDLRDAEAVRWGFEMAADHAPTALVESFVGGEDFRLLVVGGALVAAARRVPAHVVGDGRRSIAQLVDEVNRDPDRGEGHERSLTRITVDEQVLRTLRGSGYALEDVPQRGERVFLRTTGNLSTGGMAVDVTDEVHPDVAADAVRAARIVGLDVAGVDVVAPDLRRSLSETGGRIVEVNAGPGLRMHLAPTVGRTRDVAGPILDMLFPGGSRGRIPLVAITGTNGKTTTTRMVARILEQHGHRVGVATSTGITIDGRQVATGDTTGPLSARVVLDDPHVDAAVLETARGGILREGLGFDRCTVGAVLNVQDDHLGLGGIEDLDDMAWIKSLVAEVVHPDGVAVLNADDPRTWAMRERAGGRPAAFTMEGEAQVRDHVREGGVAVVRRPSARGDLIAVYDEGRRIPIVWAHEIPATFGGKATPNVQNALAAVAVAYGLGIPPTTIADALRGFGTSFEENPGRLNVFDEHPFRVVLDYGHNADGMAAMADLIRHLRGEGHAIGVVTMCGDRRDEAVLRAGRVAARLFDRVIVREDNDLRGREPGEVARLLLRGLAQEDFPDDAVRVILPEMDALHEAMESAGPGDVVMHFAEDYREAWRRIVRYRPGPAERGPQARHDHPEPA